MRIPCFDTPAKALSTSLFAFVTLSLTAVSSAQLSTVYSETFSPSVYDNSQTLSDQAGWTTNDEQTTPAGNYTTSAASTHNIIGQNDGVDFVGNVSTGTNLSNPQDYVAQFGGIYNTASPGRAAVTLDHSLPTSGATTVNFGADFLVTGPSSATDGTAAFTRHDNFGFGFNGGVAGTQLFSIGFAYAAGFPDTRLRDNVTYTIGNTTTVSPYSISLQTVRYRLSVNVNVTAGTFSAFFQPEDATGALTGGLFTIVSNATYGAGGLATSNISGLSALWNLADTTDVTANNNATTLGVGVQTAFVGRGTNALYFDNILVQVPEPSTYAMVGLGLGGLVVLARRNRRARQA